VIYLIFGNLIEGNTFPPILSLMYDMFILDLIISSHYDSSYSIPFHSTLETCAITLLWWFPVLCLRTIRVRWKMKLLLFVAACGTTMSLFNGKLYYQHIQYRKTNHISLMFGWINWKYHSLHDALKRTSIVLHGEPWCWYYILQSTTLGVGSRSCQQSYGKTFDSHFTVRLSDVSNLSVLCLPHLISNSAHG
jgi:hypothetical protein